MKSKARKDKLCMGAQDEQPRELEGGTLEGTLIFLSATAVPVSLERARKTSEN